VNAKGRSIAKCATSWQLSLQSQNKSPRTVETYLATVEQFASFLDERAMPTNVTLIEREHVEAYIAWLLDRNAQGAPATANLRYRSLQQFFKWLLAEGEIDASPMANTKPPKVPEKPVPVFEDDSIDRLLKVCAGRDFESRRDTAIIRLFDDTGMRRAELVGLMLGDVSASDRTAHVIGKGGKPRPCFFGKDTALALDRYLRLREDHLYTHSPALWLGRSGPLTGNGLGQMLRRRGEEAGVPNVHAHRFRHNMAHDWKMRGGNETALMAQAGWSSRQMLDRYGKSAAEALAKQEFDRIRDADPRQR
jgi:site-specific recombinase XerD